MQFIKIALPLAVSVVLAACGGGGGGGSDSGSDPQPVTQYGYFIDSGVDGLNYLASPSGLSGITSNRGRFGYESGDTVTFYIGNVELGSADGAGVVTPLTLAGAGDINDVQANNISRLLITLDADGDPENGITITEEVRAAAEELSGEAADIDFESDDFATDAQDLVNSVDPITPADLVTEQEAKDHLRSSLADTDEDGQIDGVDTDDDGDGVADESDDLPLDPTETVDTDGDGTGNNADTDDDDDGIPDSEDDNSLTADSVVLTIEGSITNGTVTPSQDQTFNSGKEVSLTVIPENGYRVQISGCGGVLSGDTYTTAAVSADCSISVSFTAWAIGQRYQVFGNGNIVRDLANDLEWMRCIEGMSWDSELHTCTGTAYSYTYTSAGSFEGPSGFRIPTKDELKSLVYCSSGSPSEYDISSDSSCTGIYNSPAIYADAFPETSAGFFWSSTQSVIGERDMVSFSSGGVSSVVENSGGYVRLVRRVDEIAGNSHGFPADFPSIIDNGGLGKETFLTGKGGGWSKTREQHRQVVADSGLRPIIHIHGNRGNAYKSGWSGSEFYSYLKSEYGYDDSHIWAVSYLGMGNSTSQRGCTAYARNIEDVRRFADSVMEYLDVDKVDIIGHSMGAGLIRGYINGLVYNDERLNSETVFSESLFRNGKVGTAVLLGGLNRGMGTYVDSVYGCEGSHFQNDSLFITGSAEIEALNGVNYVSAYSSFDHYEYLYKDEFWYSGLGADPGTVFHEKYSYYTGGDAAPGTKSPNYLSESTTSYTGNLPASIAARNFGIDELGLRSLYDSDYIYLPMSAHMGVASDLDVVEWFGPYLNQ